MKTKNLTLKEAIESKREFRRPHWDVYLLSLGKGYLLRNAGTKQAIDWLNRSDDLTATDYELKPEPRKPREVLVNEFSNYDGSTHFGKAFLKEASAKSWVEDRHYLRTIKFREVLEDEK